MSTSYLQEEARGVHPYAIVGGHDHLAWAKRIVWREERRDPTLSSLQVRFAKEALGIEKPKEKK